MPDKENDWINLSARSGSKIGLFLQNASFFKVSHKEAKKALSRKGPLWLLYFNLAALRETLLNLLPEPFVRLIFAALN